MAIDICSSGNSGYTLYIQCLQSKICKYAIPLDGDKPSPELIRQKMMPYQTSVSLMLWAHDVLGMPINSNNTNSTVCTLKNGAIPVYQWLQERVGDAWEFEVGHCTQASSTGQLEMLKWLRSQDPPCPWNDRVCPKRRKMVVSGC
jgi:hypothetical protein